MNKKNPNFLDSQFLANAIATLLLFDFWLLLGNSLVLRFEIVSSMRRHSEGKFLVLLTMHRS